MKKLLLTIIRLYQKTLSPDTGIFSVKHPNGYCRFYPHCSEYSYQSINKHGVIRGIFFTTKRLIRCHPFNKGGYDPIK